MSEPRSFNVELVFASGDTCRMPVNATCFEIALHNVFQVLPSYLRDKVVCAILTDDSL